MSGVNITWPGFSIWPPLQKILTVLPVPPFLSPALFPLCDSISGRVSIVRFSDGVSASCWFVQQWLAPIGYQFTFSLVFSCLILLYIFSLFSIFYIFLFFQFFLFFFFLQFLKSFLFFYNVFVDFIVLIYSFNFFLFSFLSLSSFLSRSLSLLLCSFSSEYAFLNCSL